MSIVFMLKASDRFELQESYKCKLNPLIKSDFLLSHA